MIRFGKVCDIDAAKARVRVEFPEDKITSAWLPVIVQGSAGNKYFHIFDIGEPVACHMDERDEDGVVLGAYYNAQVTPDGGSADLAAVVFSDGTRVEYDRATSKLTATIGDTVFTLSPDGYGITRGGESLFTILKDLLAAIKAETHTTSTGPSGPPINLADFVSIETRLPDLFES